jgi:hypothetical protein
MSEAKEIGTSPTSKSKAPKKKVIVAAAILIGIIVVAALIYLFLFQNSPLRNAGIAGIYDSTDPDHTGSYIELRSDGTAFLFSAYTDNPGLSSGVDGNWELRDQNRIYLTTVQGMAGYLTKDGNKLTHEGSGEIYVKRGTQGDGETDGETKKEMEWAKNWGLAYDDTAYSVVQTQDGGYAIAGYTHTYYEDYWLVKTDASGNRQWDRTYGGRWDDDAYCMVQTSDGGYILAGTSVSYSALAGGGDSGSFWLVKTDANGNALWTEGYGGKNSGAANSVVQTLDGGYVMAGYGFANLVKTDGNGLLQWRRTYGGTASCVVQTVDGGYALAGCIRGNGGDSGDFWLVKTDATGNAQWTKTFGGTKFDSANSLIQTSDGGYVMVGVTTSYGAGGSDFWLIKTDANGNHLWNRTYGGEDDDVAYSLVKTSDGGYAIVGGANYQYAYWNPIPYDAWLVKTDASGIVQWNNTYGGAGEDIARSVIQTVDGGYAIAGRTQATGSNNYEFWLVKIEA